VALADLQRMAHERADQTGARIMVTADPYEGLPEADIVYTELARGQGLAARSQAIEARCAPWRGLLAAARGGRRGSP
jgi:ornithine carbamoyltransferase